MTEPTHRTLECFTRGPLECQMTVEPREIKFSERNVPVERHFVDRAPFFEIRGKQTPLEHQGY